MENIPGLFAFPPPNRPARNRLNVKGLDRNQPAPYLPSLFRICSSRPVSDTKDGGFGRLELPCSLRNLITR